MTAVRASFEEYYDVVSAKETRVGGRKSARAYHDVRTNDAFIVNTLLKNGHASVVQTSQRCTMWLLESLLFREEGKSDGITNGFINLPRRVLGRHLYQSVRRRAMPRAQAPRLCSLLDR